MQLAPRLAALAVLTGTAAAQLALDPGTLLGLDAGPPGGGTSVLTEFSPSGAALGALTLAPQTPGFGSVAGVAVVSGELYSVGAGGLVCRFDATTGASTQCWSAGDFAPETMGSLGGEILLGDFNGNLVQRWTVEGDPVATIPLATFRGVTGLDSNGTTLFVGAYTDGNVYLYDLAGNETGVIPLGLGAGVISGIAWDGASDSLWVATGFSTNEVLQVSLTGDVLGSFPSGSTLLIGTDVVDCGFGAASETVRLGSPPNPEALRAGQTFGPFLGATYDPLIDHTSFATDSVFDALALAAGAVNIASELGTVLCDPTSPIVVTAPPGDAFAVPMPTSCELVGLSVTCQGASISAGGAIALTNALDLILGTH